MNMLKTFFAAGLFASVATGVEAQAIESVTMTSDPADVVFTVRADKPLNMPSVRTFEGQVRVRFPDADAPQAIQVKGDGAAIKLVDVRGGSHDSAMMRLDLGEDTKLSSSDVRVENRKHIMVVRIARDVLPPLREHVEEPAKKALPAPAEAPKALPAAPAPLALPAPAKKAEPGTALAPINKKSSDAADKKSLNNMMVGGTSASSPMPMLIGISAILALAYAALRLVMFKKKGAVERRAPIDIVAQKRIGARHQLVIVRAFGREHLLSIQGGNTTLIAANEEIEDNFGDKLALVTREEPTMDPPASMIQNVAISQKSEFVSRDTRSDLQLAMGGDRIRTAIQERLSNATKASESEPSQRKSNKEDKALSQAVAGLVRLRREAQL